MRGFILQPTYRVENGKAVVLLYGCLESGEPFLVRDDRQVPYFYVAAEDAEQAALAGADNVAFVDRKTFDGRDVARVETRLPAAAAELHRRLADQGIVCYEADLRLARRFLIDRGLRGAIEIEGRDERRPGPGRVFYNPELAPSRFAPRLTVLSIDIETDPRARRLLSIALYGTGTEGENTAEVLLFCPQDMTAPPGSVPFRSERELLRAFCARVRAIDPDVLTGWNVIDFDLRVLAEMGRAWGVRLELGRGPGVLRLYEARSPWATLEAQVPGRVVLDGIQLLRASFVKTEGFGLDRVAREVLGKGKLMTGDDRAREIVHTWKHERQRFVDYNLQDARLVIEILERLGLVELAVERSLLTGLAIDRVAGSVAAFEFLYLAELGRRGIVAPSVDETQRGGPAAASNLGGHVIDPQPGLYRNVLVFDFKSLYPSLIRTFQIDPLGLSLPPLGSSDLIHAPNGVAFRRGQGVLPGIVEELFPRREAAKAAGDEVTSHAIKILMNSFYGVMGTTSCRFARSELANAVTSFGREILVWTQELFESYGYRVLYGDTDSVFVLSGEDDGAVAFELGRRLAADADRDLAAHIRRTWDVESRLELEFERLYSRLLLPTMRHGRGGARKRYVGMVGEGEEAEVIFTGMEVVRRDWTELAKEVQRELYERLFHERELESYLRAVVEDLRAGRLDELLVYKKGLRRDLDSYTTTTPPHVAAARKMQGRPPRLVAYVMTAAGAEPAADVKSRIDYEHYVQKQVRPVAEVVLGVLGLDFDKVVGDDAQLELF